jgi:hypothetical protein
MSLALAPFVATPAQALVVTFDSSMRITDFFDGMPYEVKLGFLGNAQQGCCVAFEGLNFFVSAPRTVSLVEDEPVTVSVNNLVIKYPQVFSSPGPAETKQIGFDFSLLDPGVVGPSTHEMTLDANVAYVPSSLKLLHWTYGAIDDPTATFDLGVNGILDVTFLPFPATAFGAIESSHGGSGNSLGTRGVTFLLRDVPDVASVGIPEPGALLLLGSGLGLLGVALRRRRHGAMSRPGA